MGLMTPPSVWSFRTKGVLFENLAHWMKRAGYKFSFEQVAEFEAKWGSYQLGTFTINDVKTTYWLKEERYGNGFMSVKGYGSFYSRHTDEFPEICNGKVVGCEHAFNEATGELEHAVIRNPEGAPITPTSFPVAYEITKEDPLGYYAFARSDPRILYKHPDTGELLAWPEWKKAQNEYFKIIDPSDVTSVPSFILRKQMSELHDGIDSLETSVTTDLHKLQKMIELSEEVEAARDRWGHAEMQLTDGYPLCWVYSGTSSVDPTDLLALFEESGFEFSCNSFSGA
jgi:hypothetical protein